MLAYSGYWCIAADHTKTDMIGSSLPFSMVFEVITQCRHISKTQHVLFSMVFEVKNPVQVPYLKTNSCCSPWCLKSKPSAGTKSGTQHLPFSMVFSKQFESHNPVQVTNLKSDICHVR
jgi:hypothetical protein